MRRLSDGRLRRSQSEWEQIMERYRISGLSEAAFCKREKLSRSRFVVWRRELRRSATKSVPFVEVMPVEPPPKATGEFELTLPGDVTLRWKA